MGKLYILGTQQGVPLLRLASGGSILPRRVGSLLQYRLVAVCECRMASNVTSCPRPGSEDGDTCKYDGWNVALFRPANVALSFDIVAFQTATWAPLRF